MTRVLVTGGAGFIGSHLVERLASRGEAVTVLDDLSTGSLDNLAGVGDRIRFVRGDVCDTAGAAELVREADAVVHLAALTSVPESVSAPLAYHRVDVTATLGLLEACAASPVRRFVFASTCAVYGDPEGRVLRESDPTRPASPYAAAKLASESYCGAFARATELATVTLRFFNVYGPRQRPDLPYAAVVPAFVRALLEGRSPVVFGSGMQTRDFLYVEDAAEALRLALDHTELSAATFNIASGEETSVLRLLEVAAGCLGVPGEHRKEAARPGDLLRSAAEISLARSELGFVPATGLEQGIAQTLKWFSKRGEK
jgi:UDP-glucose 4-epimerase